MLLSRIQGTLGSFILTPPRILPTLVHTEVAVSGVLAHQTNKSHAENSVPGSRLFSTVASANKLLLPNSIGQLSKQINDASNSVILSNTQSVLQQQSAGLKHRGLPKLRCKHCYFIVHEERKYVMCTAYPRHKQVSKATALKEGNMIMTHATQGGRNKYNGRGTRNIKTQQSFRMDF
eukprot:TRINITY_DN10589_c0_g1_i2.p1 TRINITY_DN10589_c0_g1~~TRINITY_DN10589_c0_g1_i2.p1  ORF type:complete len:177 (-),score=17.06 TRINITY_DN10589_c0_g1_i2:797-1327(-)